MGNTLDSFNVRRGVKRRRTEENSPDSINAAEQCDHPSLEHTPKRKRTQSTAKYILKKLFEEGQDSDVTIVACGQEWRLHKLYLCQCKYFESMFSGPWIESNQSAIHMKIADENVTSEALKVVLQSLYTDNVFVKPSQATGVVAAATLLQLDPMIDHCSTVMQSSIGADTVCGFYMAAERYGLVEVKKQCQAWLQHCLMVPNFATLLCHISEQLLLSLLSSPDLWMMQVEVDVYSLLKKWVFIQMNPTWKGNRDQLYKDTEEFFRTRSEGSTDCFLEKSEGWRFIHIFDHVRWAYVLSDLSSIQLLKDDKIVPLSWLDPFVKFNWYHHLQVEQAADKGPQGVSEEQFLKESMRCGRILLQEQDYCWRWVGYNYGLDLLIMCRDRVISVKRNSGCQSFEGSISQQQQRHIMVRVNVAPIRKKDNSPSIKTTGIKSVTLRPNEEAVLLLLGTAIRFPLQVTMNLMFFSPSPEAPIPSLAVPPLSGSSSQESSSVAEDMPHVAPGSILTGMLDVQLGVTKPCTCGGVSRAGIFCGSGQVNSSETSRREDGGRTEACDLRQHGEMYVQCGKELEPVLGMSLSGVGPLSDRNTLCSSSSSSGMSFSSQDSEQPCSQSVPVSSTLLETEIRPTAASQEADGAMPCLLLSSPILDASNNSHSHRTIASSSCQLCSQHFSGRETAGGASLHHHRCESEAVADSRNPSPPSAASPLSSAWKPLLKVLARRSVHQEDSSPRSCGGSRRE